MRENNNAVQYYIRTIFELNVLPPSKIVILSITKYKHWSERSYHYINEGEIKILVRSDSNPDLYKILEYYMNGYKIVSREEKYRNVYLALESLSDQIELPFRAVRHSLSHSSEKLTDPKITEYLISNFGDVKINLKIYKNNKLFQNILNKLGEICEVLLIKKIFKILPYESTKIQINILPPALTVLDRKYYIL